MPARRDTSGLSVLKKSTKAKNERRDRQQKKWRLKSESEDEKPPPRQCRVFLYLQLQSVSNLPTDGYNMQLQLSHAKGTITQLDDLHNNGPSIDLESLAQCKPTFSIAIDQDSVDDLNMFSDHPLVVTLQKRSQRHAENSDSSDDDDTDTDDDDNNDDDEDDDEEESSDDNAATAAEDDENENEDECFETVACGLVDLLEFFTQRRAIFSVDTLLYPIVTAADPADTPTCKSTWEIYTLQPLLKHVSYTNLVYITFESIYNATPELLDLTGAITADLFFQSKIPNAKKEHDKIKICSFSTFFKSIIAEQSIHQRWESVNEGMDECYVHSGIGYTGCTISINKLFKDLLCAEDAQLDFNEIQLGADYALVSNSVRRYVLTADLSRILSDMIALNQQQILIEIYKTGCPREILMSGTLELPVLLYPKVNCCRFAVELQPAERPVKGTNPSLYTSQRKKSSNTQVTKKKTFATLNVCLLSPLIENSQLPQKVPQPEINNDQNPNEECMPFKPVPIPNTPATVLAATYKRFDEEIEILANRIVQSKIRNFTDARPPFYDELQSLTTIITKLVSSDFNSRIPTNTNHDFSRAMTIAYQELVQRIYTILQNYSGSNLQYIAHDASDEAKILQFMNIVKLCKEAGDKALGALLFEKLNKIAKNQPYFNFYVFLLNMELLNYDGAKQYLERPLQERYSKAAYYEHWVRIYLQYLKFQEVAESYNLAFDHLLESIKPLTVQYPCDLEAWALLYCMYKSCGYTPGENFARLKLESLYDVPRREFPTIPKSRWNMYLNYELTFPTRKYNLLRHVLQVFLRIGTFRFAEIIFTQISKMCTSTEKYFMVTTFKILLKEVPPVYPAQTSAIETMDNAELLKAFEVHTNGNLAFHGGVTKTAMRNYEHILDIKHLTNFESFELGLLRYAFFMSQQHKYENAIKAFGKCSILGADSIITYLGLGKAMYRLNRLQEAEMYFAQCTQYGMHIPDVWAYLALINHKMGYICKAVEFWKYAKLNPESEISNEILIEFSKITSKDKSRFVGNP